VRQAQEPRQAPPERRIIERPRLLNQLEETDARIILLVAPAGYGKTTLARQWARGKRCAWLSGAVNGGDFATVARDLAKGLAGIGSFEPRLVEEALLATGSPVRQAQTIARVVLEEFSGMPGSWLFIDDYHLLDAVAGVEELLAPLEANGRFRLLVSSRNRPAWASSRRFVYGEITEVGRDDLALNTAEASEVLGRSVSAFPLAEEARGWPAAVGLLAIAPARDSRATSALPEQLYDFIAEEIYANASSAAQGALLRLALLPPLDNSASQRILGIPALRAAESTGLVQASPSIEIHPLAREFLFAKLRERRDFLELVDDAISFSLANRSWDHAFVLITHFAQLEQLDDLITSSYSELIAQGRVQTLERFADHAARFGGTRQPVLDLIEAEVAFRNGLLDRAQSLGELAASNLGPDHALLARSFVLSGSAAHLNWKLEEAYGLFGEALLVATQRRDVNAAAWGRCLAALYLEDDRLRVAVEEFGRLADIRAEDRLRLLLARQHLARLTGGSTTCAQTVQSRPRFCQIYMIR